jgi:hypothetical protein
MLSAVVALLMFLSPFPEQVPLKFEIRAQESLKFGKGMTSGVQYYDLAVTRQPNNGVLVKLDYSRRNTTFVFDLHHRVSLDPDFVYPAEITTNIEVLSGGTTSIGSFTIVDIIKAGDVFEESVDKVSKADVDRYVTPFGKKTITMKLGTGSQSLSIVGSSVIITRGTKNARNDTPGQRIALVSNFKYFEDQPGTLLTID